MNYARISRQRPIVWTLRNLNPLHASKIRSHQKYLCTVSQKIPKNSMEKNIIKNESDEIDASNHNFIRKLGRVIGSWRPGNLSRCIANFMRDFAIVGGVLGTIQGVIWATNQNPSLYPFPLLISIVVSTCQGLIIGMVFPIICVSSIFIMPYMIVQGQRLHEFNVSCVDTISNLWPADIVTRD
jgi:hypothetical protein